MVLPRRFCRHAGTRNCCSVRSRDGFQHHPLVSGGLRATGGGAAGTALLWGSHGNRSDRRRSGVGIVRQPRTPEERHRRPWVERPRRRPERDGWSSLQAPVRGAFTATDCRWPVSGMCYPRCDQHRGPLRGASMAAGLSVQGRAYVTGHDTGLFVVAGGVAWPDVLGGPAERYIHGRGGPAERMNLDAPPSG